MSPEVVNRTQGNPIGHVTDRSGGQGQDIGSWYIILLVTYLCFSFSLVNSIETMVHWPYPWLCGVGVVCEWVWVLCVSVCVSVCVYAVFIRSFSIVYILALWAHNYMFMPLVICHESNMKCLLF